MGADTSRSGTATSPTFSGSCGPQSAPLAPNCAASLDRGQLLAGDWSRCPPRREIASIMPQISGFPLGWSGSWEERGGRPRGEFGVVVRPARLRRGVLRALPMLPPYPWPSPRSSRLLLFCRLVGNSLLEVMSAQVKMGRFPHKRSTGCRKEKESHPTSSCCPRKDSHIQIAQVLIASPGRSGDIPQSLVLKSLVRVGGGMGSYFFFDMPLTTIRKREREAILPEEMPFIKADKTNRASFPVVMVLKARLIMLVGFIPLWPLLDSIYAMEKFIFLNFSALLSKTRVKLGS